MIKNILKEGRAMAFMDKNFLLTNETAKKLFFDFAQDAPIFDFHCHLSPAAIYDNEPFADLAEAWLGGDHYKWRAMRAFGADEKYITGDAPGREKFSSYVKALSMSPGNPLYHWSHLELQRYFDIYEPLTEKNAGSVFDTVNKKLKSDGFRPRDFIKKSNVTNIITTDDPVDDLKYHDALAADDSFATKVTPAFRPDKLFGGSPSAIKNYIAALSNASGVDIKTFGDLKEALASRLAYFTARGAAASDHGLPYIPYADASETEIEQIFSLILSGTELTVCDADRYRTALLVFLAGEYKRRGVVMELHYGAMRNINSKMFIALGPDAGYDSIGDRPSAENLARLLDKMNETGGLPRVMLFPINPGDYYVAAAVAGCFSSSEANEQFGAAWWFNDHYDGMSYQLKTLANLGVLGKFTGMLTDSRSFLSYPRHEYFRRILANIVGGWVESGEFCLEYGDLGKLITDICYNNAAEYFSRKI